MKNKFKILLTRKLHDFVLRELEKKYDVTVHSGKIPIPKKILMKKIKDKEGLICFPYDMIDSDVIKSGKKLKCISTYSVGFDHIDVKLAKKRRIKIGYTPEVLTDATADLTVTLILDVLRRVSEGDRMIREGRWKEIFGAYDYVGTDVKGKTIGILGMGRIGKAVAKRLNPFGVKIIYHNRNSLSKTREKSLHAKLVTMNTLFKSSDIISIHIPYSKETHEIVDEKLLGKMKKSAFLVNTSRGKIINESNLIKALKQRKISGAALDVFRNEPIGKKHMFTKMENVVLVPHIGSSSKETREKMAEITMINLKLGLDRKKLLYSV